MPDVCNFLLYRLRVRSDFALVGESIDEGNPDIHFVRKGADERTPFALTDSTLLYRNAVAGVELHIQAEACCLRYPAVGDFYFCDDRRVDCHVHRGVSEEIVASILQGAVIAVLLEKRGAVCLHASAVQIDNSAVAFLGDSGSGKSSMAGRFVELGYPLITDDILALSVAEGPVAEGQWMALPSFAQIKLCADMATGLPDDSDYRPAIGKHLRRVGEGWGRFASEPLPLRVAYVLHRHDRSDAPAIENLSPGDGFAELLRLSFCARVIGPLGLEKSRFERLAQIASGVAVRRIEYANGEENLNAACKYLRQSRYTT